MDDINKTIEMMNENNKKTRKNHRCHNCRSIIPKGSRAETKSEWDGTTSYYHFLYDECDYTEHNERMRKINETTQKSLEGKDV